MSNGIKCRFYVDVMAFHPEVTGSCLLVVVKYPDGTGTKFIVDCGLFQEKELSNYNTELPFDASQIEFALITHNHVDHTGRLPFIIKKGFYRNIYVSRQTSVLIEPALEDSYRVLKSVAKRENRVELYSIENVGAVLNNMQKCEYYENIHITSNIKAIFFPNGHLPGAALILVQISYPEYEDINLLFTGDYNKSNIFFDVSGIPEEIRKLPITIIQESTYGNMNSWEIEKTYVHDVTEAIRKGKTVINPAYSLGRTQEVLYEIKLMQERGEIERDIPIYLDGKLAIRYTNLYRKLEIKKEMQNFLPDNLTFVDKEIRQKLLSDNNSKIIVTSSGSGSYGPAQTYIQEYLARADAKILFTGYTPEGSLGRRLKDTEYGETVEVGGLLVEKRAQVGYTREFSAHAKADEMIDFLNQFENLRMVLVNHGQTGVKEQFARRILREVKAKHVGVLGREYFFRVGTYGLIKTMGTKFE